MMKKIEKYPAPKSKCSEFKKRWKILLPKVVDRENFHESFLEQLSILCDLYVEYDVLTKFVKENGYSYATDGRYGESYRLFEEVKERKNVLSEIRAYSKLLGITLHKDTQVKEESEDNPFAKE